MFKNIVFDFGGVLVDWNPRYLMRPYFNDDARCEWFIANVCNTAWNDESDRGKPFGQAVEERCAMFPEFADDIRYYRDNWIKTMGGQLPGAYDMVKGLKDAGYGIYGLTNWSVETFNQVRYDYPIFKLMEGMVVSGEEGMVKPDPAIFRLLCDRYGLKPEECVFTDDKAGNVDAAKTFGMKGIIFNNNRQFLDELQIISKKV